MVQAFGLNLDTAHKLCGGYSSVNYRINQTGGDSMLLRVAVGLPLAAAERQSRVLCAVAQSGVPCPQIMSTLTGEYVLPCQTENNQTGFAMVHSWVEGVTANKRAEEDEAGMMRRLGQLLAKLHSCEPAECGLLDASADEYMCVCSLFVPDVSLVMHYWCTSELKLRLLVAMVVLALTLSIGIFAQ